VLASVFASSGGYESPAAFTDGVTAALPIAAVVLAAGAAIALLVPGRARTRLLVAQPSTSMSAT
jgi:hypothetical protein